MSKTVAISERVHILITRKQIEFRERYNINLKISEIVNFILEHNIDTLKDVIRDDVLQKDVIRDDVLQKGVIRGDVSQKDVIGDEKEGIQNGLEIREVKE